MAISTNGTVLARLAGALYNTQMSNATYAEVASLDPSALANTLYARDFSASTDAAVATTLVTNLGLASVTGLDNWVAAQLTAAGSAKGAKVVELLNSFAQMTADTTYGAFATAFNTKVDAALALSQTAGNKGGTFAAAGTIAVTNATFTLTSGIDSAALFTGGAGNDSYVGTHLTFNATDVLNGGAGTDTLTITDTGSAAFSTPSALVSGIENVSIRNLNGTAAVSEVAEQQIVYASGAAAATTNTAFLGVNTAVTSADTATAVATAIVANKANIIAGSAAIAAGVTDLTDNGGGSIIITYGGALGKGDVSNIAAASASNGTSFSAGIEYRKGVSAVAANTYTDTVAAGTFVDAIAFTSDNSTSPVSFTGLAAGQTVTVLGNTATSNGATTAAWGSTVTSPTLKLSGGTTGGAVTLTAAGANTVNLESTGAPLGTTGLPGTNTVGSVDLGGKADSTLAIKADSNISLSSGATFTTASKSIVVSGAATSVSFGAGTNGTTAITASNLESVDASGLTAGGVSIALTTGTKSFVGGEGADTVATAAFTNTGVKVNGGAGSDTLIISSATDLDTPLEAARYSNFETIRTTGSFDASLLTTATGFQISGTSGTLTNLTAGQAANVRLRADGSSFGVSLYDASGATDSTTVTLGSGSSSANAVDISTGLTANGFETINLKATPGSAVTSSAGNTSTVAAFTADKATAINLTGTAFSLSNIATTKAVTIDGSALTGDKQTAPTGLTAAGNAAVGSTLIGSSVADSFTLGTVGSTYLGGAGKDAFSSSVANLVSSGVYNVINGGDDVDTLTISDAAALTITDTQFAKITNVEKITVTSTTTGNQSITTGGWFDQNFKLTGATVTTTATKGNITVDASTFTGSMTIVATEAGTQAGEGKLTITTGSGNDSVTVTTAAAGDDDVISLGDGNDVFVGGVDAESITGGRGQDTLTGGGTTANTYVFTAGSTGASDALFDTITDFSAVAANVINAGAASIVTNAVATSGVASIATSGLATFATSDSTVAQRIIAVEAGINAGGTAAAGQAAMWQQGSDVYVLISDGVDGVSSDDILIKLIGVDTTNASFDTLTDGGTTFTIA